MQGVTRAARPRASRTLGSRLFANDRCRDVVSTGCTYTTRTAALATTHAGAREPEVFVAWQAGSIAVRAVTRVPLLAKAAEEGHLDGNANPDDDNDEYDPTRDVHA